LKDIAISVLKRYVKMKPYKETSYSTFEDGSEDGIDIEVTDYKIVNDNLDFNTRYTTVLKERASLINQLSDQRCYYYYNIEKRLDSSVQAKLIRLSK
jgi:hypothetical protein